MWVQRGTNQKETRRLFGMIADANHVLCEVKIEVGIVCPNHMINHDTQPKQSAQDSAQCFSVASKFEDPKIPLLHPAYLVSMKQISESKSTG